MPSPSWLACSECSCAYSAHLYASAIEPRGSQPPPIATCSPASRAARSESVRRPVGVPSPRERPDASRAESLAQRVDLAPPPFSRPDSPAALRTTPAGSLQHEYRAERTLRSLGTSGCLAANGSRPEVEQPRVRPLRDSKTDTSMRTPRPRQEVPPMVRPTNAQPACKPNDQAIPTRVRASTQASQTNSASRACKPAPLDASTRAANHTEDAQTCARTQHCDGTSKEADGRVRTTLMSTPFRPPSSSPLLPRIAPPHPHSTPPPANTVPTSSLCVCLLASRSSRSGLSASTSLSPLHFGSLTAHDSTRTGDPPDNSRPEAVQPRARPQRDGESDAPTRTPKHRLGAQSTAWTSDAPMHPSVSRPHPTHLASSHSPPSPIPSDSPPFAPPRPVSPPRFDSCLSDPTAFKIARADGLQGKERVVRICVLHVPNVKTGVRFARFERGGRRRPEGSGSTLQMWRLQMWTLPVIRPEIMPAGSALSPMLRPALPSSNTTSNVAAGLFSPDVATLRPERVPAHPPLLNAPAGVHASPAPPPQCCGQPVFTRRCNAPAGLHPGRPPPLLNDPPASFTQRCNAPAGGLFAGRKHNVLGRGYSQNSAKAARHFAGQAFASPTRQALSRAKKLTIFSGRRFEYCLGPKSWAFSRAEDLAEAR
ncbi:uncharacterized protein B0H18DRAFT_961052 [Fomitopsis serialis]|uniref:uncharacterized protein n=1 Tax=Fomitopsis serialis TaxID=139415 RepID=UPI0020082552|nr:uncharacterized protein B0H18DRAFT_961052 [Neoantrodia serialis]KAH9912444.1 hypothetical protein B0H18DRAFT_961052 [Neoantrodia serialis]